MKNAVKSINLASEVKTYLQTAVVEPGTRTKIVKLLAKGKLTRDENPYSHICVYFAGYNAANKTVLIGKHRKSSLWLFNGGHVDEGETLLETVKREMGKEWGIDSESVRIEESQLLTITSIENPLLQKCKIHIDSWFFVSLDPSKVILSEEKMHKEFFEMRWGSIAEAKKLVIEKNTRTALNLLEQELTI